MTTALWGDGQSERGCRVGDDPAVVVSLRTAGSQRTVYSMSSSALAPVARRREGVISLWPFRAARGPFAGLWLVG